MLTKPGQKQGQTLAAAQTREEEDLRNHFFLAPTVTPTAAVDPPHTRHFFRVCVELR